MIGLLLKLLRRRCSCDQRFIDVAHDIDCPVHGLEVEIAASWK